MARIQEERHPGESKFFWWLGNITAIDSDYVLSLGIAWLFKENDKWRFIPRITDDNSLFYNAVFFARYTTTPFLMIAQGLTIIYTDVVWGLLFGLFFSVRWSSATDKKALFQTGLGWKLNGRLGLLLRVQSDKTSAAGVTGPNLGQATGYTYGTH